LDRIVRSLTDNVTIIIETRYQKQIELSTDPTHVVNIHLVDKPPPAAPPIQYAFHVSFSSAIEAGFTLLEAYPNSCWEERGNDTINLFLNFDDSILAATLCFHHEQHQTRFAVTLGFCDKVLKSDLHFLKDKE
jgi:hypothetical protein